MARTTASPKRELTLQQQQKVESEIASFGKRWGIELTAQETARVFDRATERIAGSEKGIQIRPAVRDQMFALLIEKDPGRAIELRMSMLEKQGKNIGSEKRDEIVAIAQDEGWQAAREALSEATRKTGNPQKPRANVAEVSLGAKAIAPKRREVGLRTARVEQEAKGHQSSGLTLAELLDSAEKKSRTLARAGEDYNAWKEDVETVRMKQLKIFGKKNPGAVNVLQDKKADTSSSKYRSALAEFESYLEKKNSPACHTKIRETEQRHIDGICVLKRVRDDVLTRAVLAAGGTQSQANQLVNLRDEGVTRGLHQNETIGNQAIEFGAYGVYAVNMLRQRTGISKGA